MAIGPDRIQVLKQESASNGGDGADDVPYTTAIEPQEDALEAAGVYLQDAGNRDETVYVERDAGNLRLRDQQVTTPKSLGSIVNHAAEHAAGGVQPVEAQDLSSGAAAAGKLLQANGAGAWTLVDVVSGVPANLNTVSDDTLSTTTSTTFQLKLTLTTSSLPAGDYVVFWSYVVSGSSNNTETESYVDHDGVMLYDALYKAATAGAEAANAGHAVLPAISGVHDFHVYYRHAAGSGESGVRRVVLTLWLVDN